MKFILSGILLFTALTVSAQHSADYIQANKLPALQDSLVKLGKEIVNNPLEPERYNANYTFIKTLVNALRQPKSFNFSFDSLKTVSIKTATDRKFRIFSWHVMNDDGSYRYFGAIQMNTNDGKLKLFPLIDYSPLIKDAADTTTSADKWYGAQYYQIIPVNNPNGQTFYTLLGWKGNTKTTTKKVIETLYFKDGNPYFGLPVFDGNSKDKEKKRVIFEYSREVSMLLNWSEQQQQIVFDHLSPYDEKLMNDFSKYGPDMTYDGYQLVKGRWKFQQNLILKNPPSEMDDHYNDPEKLKSNQPIRKY